MEEKKILEEFSKVLLGEYGFAIVCLAVLFFFKTLLENAIYGILFLAGNDFNADDIVYMYGERKARIVRLTMFKTVFYMYDSNRKLVVQGWDSLEFCPVSSPAKSEGDFVTQRRSLPG